MELNRQATKRELALLDRLIEISEIEIPNDWKDRLLVRQMDDDGMGSLLLYPNGENEITREMGEKVSELIFKDEDGVDVIASLNIDIKGNLYELDIWKIDFTPLKKWPDTFNQ